MFLFFSNKSLTYHHLCLADPEFQAEMKKLTDSPQFKKMQEKSEDIMEGLEQDPVKLKMLQKQMEDMMGK